MDTFKGTKGEWKHISNNLYEEVTANHQNLKMRIGIHLLTGEPIKSISLSLESKANAKLIAAAPDLLAALIRIQEEHGIGDPIIEKEMNDAIKKALK